jgi:hypothetical protein
MSKIVNISEEKFRKALRSIVKEQEDVYNNYEVFNDQENAIPNPNDRTLDNHEESTAGVNNIDQTVYEPDGNKDIENP